MTRFDRAEMEAAGWTFTDDGRGIPPSGGSATGHALGNAGKHTRAERSSSLPAPVGQQDVLQDPGVTWTEPLPKAVVGIDPGVRATGLAYVTRGFCTSKEVRPRSRRRRREHKCEFDAARLREIGAFVYTELRCLCLSTLTGPDEYPPIEAVVVEDQYYRRRQDGKVISAQAIATLAKAVATCHAAATRAMAHLARPGVPYDEVQERVKLVPPDWAKRVLLPGRGKTRKRDRWWRAERVIRTAYEHPDLYDVIGRVTDDPDEAHEHRWDAYTLCAAWVVKPLTGGDE